MRGPVREAVPPGPSSDWSQLLGDHASAVGQFVEAARRFPAEAWTRALAPGKWSPAEITSHVAEAYEVLRGELGGGPGMRLLGSPLQRWLLRHTMLPRILRGRPFPAGARAPREIRPREIQDDPAIALAALVAGADAFARDLSARAADRRLRLSHAYFGPMSARQSLQLAAVHTRHHARQLAAAAP
jgi:DinB family protein